MSKPIVGIAIALLFASSAALAAEEKETPKPDTPSDTDVTLFDRGNPDENRPSSEERGTTQSLSTVIAKDEDGKRLNMEEKWSDDVVVCKRQKVTGSRITRKVCQTRGEWQALRINARESTEAALRRALIYGVDGG